MRSNALSSKLLVALLCLFALLTTGLTSLAQKRVRPSQHRAPQKSSSRAAGITEEADKLLDEGKPADAVDAYKIAIRLDPNYAPAYAGLGDAYFNSGKWEEGLAAYKEQVRLEPRWADTAKRLRRWSGLPVSTPAMPKLITVLVTLTCAGLTLRNRYRFLRVPYA
jgi:tetratricopeptide (TPR) repeat protein